MSEERKKKYYLQQNKRIAWVEMVKALGYEVDIHMNGSGYSYSRNGHSVIPEELPTDDEYDQFIFNLERGLTMEECKAELLKNYEEATITKTIKYLKRK